MLDLTNSQGAVKEIEDICKKYNVSLQIAQTLNIVYIVKEETKK